MKEASRGRRVIKVPTGVWVLGVVSLLTDVSSEMIHSVLPLFLVGTLHLSVLAVGALEGMAEALALVLKVFSGVLSDRWRKRKPLVLTGYGLSAVTKPLFALAEGAGGVVFARLADRFGKGIRGAPRDALLTDITPRQVRGEAFGLRQSLDTLGAILGPLIALVLLLHAEMAYRALFWWAAVPALAAVALLWIGVREPAKGQDTQMQSWRWRDVLHRLPRAFWKVVVLGVFLGLARFSEAFLLLRAETLGVDQPWIPGVLLLLNVLYALTAYPAGWASDRWAREHFLAAGLVVLLLADLVLAAGRSQAALVVGTCLWGVHLGLTQGTLNALVADAVPESLRGTAFGVLNLAMGVSLLLSSLVAGALWTYGAPDWPFYAGAFWSGLAWLMLLKGENPDGP